MERLAGKNAIVTGAGHGIGRGIALRLAEEGASVVVAYGHDIEKAEETADLIRGLERKVLVTKCDVTLSSDVAKTVEAAIREFGSIDVLVNNAGIARDTPFIDISEEEWDLMLDTHLKGSYLCSQQVARSMIGAGRGGTIINISSIKGSQPVPLALHYSAAKAGLESLTRGTAYELAPYGIRVNAIEPGATVSGMTHPFLAKPDIKKRMLESIPLHRIGTPEDVGNLVVFLASSESDYITGAIIPVDGGVLTAPTVV